ncbi:MAG: Lrp/AsnC family transcriptional regulator [Candidatus Woesearchaeota archaeon]
MELNKNEKKVLKFLIDNSRVSDADIAVKLRISSQAVGKIRRKLESTVIDSYTVNINYSKIGIHILAVAIAKITREGLDKGQLEVEQELQKNPHIIRVYRLPKHSSTHLISYGFKDMAELDNFFYSPKLKQELHNYFETQELFIFSNNSLIKNSSSQLLHKIIDDMGLKNSGAIFHEIDTFRKKLVT